MGSNAKKRTTMAKLNRENSLREKRMEKQAKKDARKREAAMQAAVPAAERPDTTDEALAS